MIWIFTILGIIIGYIILTTVINKNTQNKLAYNSLPDEIKFLIKTKNAPELAKLIVYLELKGENQLALKTLDAIGSVGISFAMEVDKFRNVYRHDAGLGKLKNF